MTAVQALQAPIDAAQALEERIRFTQSEADLDRLAEQIQAHFEAGYLSQPQAEGLTGLSIEMARQLEAGLVNVPVAAFIGKEETSGVPTAAD